MKGGGGHVSWWDDEGLITLQTVGNANLTDVENVDDRFDHVLRWLTYEILILKYFWMNTRNKKQRKVLSLPSNENRVIAGC